MRAPLGPIWPAAAAALTLALAGCGSGRGATVAARGTPALTAAGEPVAVHLEPPAAERLSAAERAEFDRGRAVAAQAGCLACHRIGDAGNEGPGPELTDVAARLPRAAIARTLVAPVAPMPSYSHLPRPRFDALVTFLSLLR